MVTYPVYIPEGMSLEQMDFEAQLQYLEKVSADGFDESECRVAFLNYVCSFLFRRCSENRPTKVCRSECISYVDSCTFFGKARVGHEQCVDDDADLIYADQDCTLLTTASENESSSANRAMEFAFALILSFFIFSIWV